MSSPPVIHGLPERKKKAPKRAVLISTTAHSRRRNYQNQHQLLIVGPGLGVVLMRLIAAILPARGLFSLFPLDSIVNLFPMHRYTPGSIDTESYLVAPNIDNRNLYIVADYDRLVLLSA